MCRSPRNTCNICGKLGHVGEMCWSVRQQGKGKSSESGCKQSGKVTGSGKRVRRGVTDGKPSDVNGVKIVKEESVDVFSIGQVNEFMSVKVYCGGIEVRALIDNGCMVSVVYKKVYDRMKIREDQKELKTGEIKELVTCVIPCRNKI
ncbi:hypothetical protein Avbf_14727 [Armadillidium vulgare]|nr:hypothetical protein Avbf_14727 [Armadillidium vulgare]